MPMFPEFYIGTLHMAWLNFGVNTLIPKIVGAMDLRHSRQIMVINVLPRIFAMVCTMRVALVVECLSHPYQTAFL